MIKRQIQKRILEKINRSEKLVVVPNKPAKIFVLNTVDKNKINNRKSIPKNNFERGAVFEMFFIKE